MIPIWAAGASVEWPRLSHPATDRCYTTSQLNSTGQNVGFFTKEHLDCIKRAINAGVYIYMVWNHKAACCQSVAAVAVRAFCLLAYNRLKALLNRDVAHMYIGTTDVVRGCWFLTPPLRLMLFQTSLCWNLTTNMLNRNDIMLFLCWVSQPVHFTKLRYWQKTVV